MKRWGQEWGYALRQLVRAPGHAATCIVLLAIGLASTTAILAVGQGLLRRPLPVQGDERLIVPYGSRGDDKRLSASAVEAEAWRRAPSLAGFAVARPQAVTLDHGGEPERLRAARVEAGFLPLLGIRPLLGRAFGEAESRAEARVVVIGFALWQRRFGGDPGLVGSALRIDGEEWQVIGVMPRGFDLPIGCEVWRPLHLATVPVDQRGNRIFDPVARLAPGRSLDQARAELALIAHRLEQERPDTNAGWGVRAIALRRNLLDDPDGTLERAIGLTSWGAAFLLLIACANVAQLQIVRAVDRLGELGTRLALGASRASLVRMLAFESLSLSAIATLLSLPLSWALAKALLRLGPVSASAFSSHLLGASYSPRVLGAAGLAALVTAALTGLYPALRVARTDVSGLLSGGLRTSHDRGRRAFLQAAVVAQVAVTVTLLSATVSLGESYALLRGLDVGFRPGGLSYYELSLSPRDYADHERRAAFAEALVEAVRGIDGVVDASFTTNVPLAPPGMNWIARHGCEGRAPAPGEMLITADRLVGAGHLETLGVRLLAGRTLTDRDTASSERVAVISKSLADECWPGEVAVGRRVLRYGRLGPVPIHVVGVVADPQEQRVSFGAPHASWYLPYRQHAFQRDLNLVVRGDASAAQVRALVRRLDPHQPVSGPRLLSEHLEAVTGSERVAALVMGYFAVLGLALVGVGIQGSMERFVVQQHRAFGVRIALGADPRQVASSVLRRGLALAGLGAVIGLAGAAAAHQLTAAFVHGALLVVPARLGVTAAAILLLAAVACATPAWRAGRIDPARLLRTS